MNKEEKEAIKYFYNLRATIDESNMLFDEDLEVKCGKETIKQISTILNLTEKQDKVIDKMAEYIEDISKNTEVPVYKQAIIDFYYKKVEEENE